LQHVARRRQENRERRRVELLRRDVIGGPDDTDVRGRWIPTSSTDQYGATLCSWFGIPSSGLAGVFPNLANFPTVNLGFLG
jgi:hypothetical protein